MSKVPQLKVEGSINFMGCLDLFSTSFLFGKFLNLSFIISGGDLSRLEQSGKVHLNKLYSDYLQSVYDMRGNIKV